MKDPPIEKQVRFADRTHNPSRPSLPSPLSPAAANNDHLPSFRSEIQWSTGYSTDLSPSLPSVPPAPQEQVGFHQSVPRIKFIPPTPGPLRSNDFFNTPQHLPIFSTPFIPPPAPSQVFPLVETLTTSPNHQIISTRSEMPFRPLPPKTISQPHGDFFQRHIPSPQRQSLHQSADGNVEAMEISPPPSTPSPHASDFFASKPVERLGSPLPTLPPQHASDFFTRKTVEPMDCESPPPPRHASDFFKYENMESTSFRPTPIVHASDFFKSGKEDSFAACPTIPAPTSLHSSNSFKSVSADTPLPSPHVKMDPPQQHTVLDVKQPVIKIEDPPIPSFPKFVFNTDNLLATRQTERSWRGSRQAMEWVLSQEELHAYHVDLDRELPSEMEDPWYPSFVSMFSLYSSRSNYPFHSGNIPSRPRIIASIYNGSIRYPKFRGLQKYFGFIPKHTSHRSPERPSTLH